MRRIARAREIGADSIADEVLEIIDTPLEMTTGENPKRDAAHAAWLRNRAELRLKLLAKWHPRRYGDRQVLAGDPDSPLMEALDDTQRAAKLRAILDAARARCGLVDGDDPQKLDDTAPMPGHKSQVAPTYSAL
jgi:hypothetical protein